MFEQSETSGISNDHAVQRMFELVSEGRTDSSEYALLDAVIQSRLRQTYDEPAAEPSVQAVPEPQRAAA